MSVAAAGELAAVRCPLSTSAVRAAEHPRKMPGLLEEQHDKPRDEKKAFPHAGADASNAPLPKGVVLGKDGKPYASLDLQRRLYG